MKMIKALLCLLLTWGIASAQCPKLVGAMIDACNANGFEGDNEFILFKNGTSAIPVNSVQINYSSDNLPSSGSPKNTFKNLTGTYSAAMQNYVNLLNLEAYNTGCPNLINTSSFTTIPANAMVIVMSPMVSQVYNLNTYCSSAPIYVVFDTYYGSTGCGGNSGTLEVGFNRCGTFKNDGNATSPASANMRYFSIKTTAAGGSCSETIYNYNYTLLGPSTNAVDGGYVSWSNGTPTYSNGGCQSIVLPLSSLSFDGFYNGKKAMLQWKVEGEKEILDYTVERSADGYSFEPIGSIPARGNDGGRYSYELTDASPLQQRAYYRLAVREQKGATYWSRIIRIEPNESTQLNAILSPVPAKGVATLQWRAATHGKATITLTDNLGRTLIRQEQPSTPGLNTYKFSTLSFSPGLYYVNISLNGQGQVVKLVVE